jgi:hypothetical protein
MSQTTMDEVKVAPIHILMRFSDAFMSVDDTIVEHQEVIDRHNSVWVAKVGKPLGAKHIETIRKQIKEGIPTYVYLVQRVGTEYKGYRGTLAEIQREKPDSAKLMPAYYKRKGIDSTSQLWMKVTKLTAVPKKDGLSKLHIASSKRSVPKTLATSMAAIFVIKDGPGSTYV